MLNGAISLVDQWVPALMTLSVIALMTTLIIIIVLPRSDKRGVEMQTWGMHGPTLALAAWSLRALSARWRYASALCLNLSALSMCDSLAASLSAS
eukprot:scaffold129655_cov19-Prasinocladus_malaysianus.AAC.1